MLRQNHDVGSDVISVLNTSSMGHVYDASRNSREGTNHETDYYREMLNVKSKLH